MYGYDIDDVNGLPRALLWHLITFHPEAQIRVSCNENGYHIKHESYCEFCFSFGDSNHYAFAQQGINVLFNNKGGNKAGCWNNIDITKTIYPK